MTFSNIKRMLDYFVHEQALLYFLAVGYYLSSPFRTSSL